MLYNVAMAKTSETMVVARAPRSLTEALNAVARSRGMNQSQAVREALTQWLDREAKAAN